MPKIIINRKGEWANRLRKINVFIDGRNAGGVKNDGSEEFVLEPGKHTVECKIDWCSCKPVEMELREGDVKILKLQSGVKYMWVFYIVIIAAFVGRMSYRLSDKPVPDWVDYAQTVLFSLALVYLVYFLTIGRKQYLSLTEDKDNIFNH
jgi:hypothetical protein